METVAREVFRTYNYHEIRTPILEETQLFARGVGAETDIVTKEMYTFTDRDETSLTLRPENTASVIRAYIEHRLDQRPGVQKLYYMGPMFRRERPQKGRYRQFFQIGAEAIGSESPVVDAEVIEMVMELLDRAGLAGAKLLLNSVGDHNCRPQYVERLRQELKSVAPQMCGDCQRRAETNPLRVLDCKVEADQAIIDRLPSILDFLCDDCRTHFDAVQAVPARPRHRVRSAPAHGARPGLLHAHDLRGGARRAGRAELRAGRRALRRAGRIAGLQGTFAGHRLLHRRRPPGDERGRRPGSRRRSICSSRRWERRRCATRRRWRASSGAAGTRWKLVEGKLKRAMELANKAGARFALIIGDDEMAAGRYALKDMSSGEQQQLTRERNRRQAAPRKD